MQVILIVEDSTLLLQMLSSVLQSKGFEVLKANNGYEALKALDGRQIDLVITDLIMPVMDGFELARRIRGMDDYKTVPIFMLTAQSDDRAKNEGMAAGITDWILKPVSPENLLVIVRRHLP